MDHPVFNPSESRLNPLLQRIALVGWAVIVLANLALFVADLISDYAEMLVPCGSELTGGGTCNFLALSAVDVSALTSWGWTTQTYAMLMLIPPLILLLGYWALAGLILLRQGGSWFRLMVSLGLIVLPVATVSGDNDWSGNEPLLFLLAVIVALVGNVVEVTFLYLLPNGRFSPRWATIPLTLTLLLLTGLMLEINGIITLAPQALSLLEAATIGLVLLGGALQIHRYLRNSNAVERQQTKWILFGIISYILSVMVWVLIFGRAAAIPSGTPRLLANLAGWFFINTFALLILPAAITIAILRYRLWDIDLIVRRTLVYTVLTALLALVYFGLVVLLQTVFESAGGERSPIAIVISTLVIAALFAPLRRRVQEVIDRRFFRRRYDAQQVLEQFAQTARDETELDALTAELLRVVQETMQPEGIQLWMKR